MRFLSLLATLAVLITAPLTCAAQRHRLVIPFDNYRIQGDWGEPATLFLKRELRQRYPKIVVRDLDLRKVVLVARSRHGRGVARLRVGEHVTSPRRVARGGHRHNTSWKSDLYRVRFRNPSLDSRGAWQILLDGRFVINKVVMVVEDRSYRIPAGHFERPEDGYGPPERWSDHDSPEIRRGSTMLQIRVWGTDMEREKPCSQHTSNAPDGWSKPQNVCHPEGEARFAKGYPPVRIYIRPDVSGLMGKKNSVVEGLRVRVTARGSKGTRQQPISATLGIDIGGQTYTRNFRVMAGSKHTSGMQRQTLVVKGWWRPKQLHNAKVWVRPNQSTGDFMVRQLSIEALGS